MPLGVASTGASAAIVSPGEGATVPERTTVAIHYAGYSPAARNVSGQLFLDGAWAGNFVAQPVRGSPANGTTVTATLRGENFTSGAHALTARVFTDVDAPIETPPVDITLDLAPRVSVEAGYDLDARDVVAVVTVVDEASANVTLGVAHSPDAAPAREDATNATVAGTATMRLAADRAPGAYAGRVTARDALGQERTSFFTVVVEDRPTSVSDLVATYQQGGFVKVDVSMQDLDGARVVEARIGHLVDWTAVNTTAWQGSLLVPVEARLGTWNGSLRAIDRHGHGAAFPFTFEIGGEEEVIFQQEVSTQLGSHQDVASIPMPRVGDGMIEICIDTCDDANGTLAWPPQSGQFRPCDEAEPAAWSNLPAWAVWYAAQAADRGELFRPENGPALAQPWPAPGVATGVEPGFCDASVDRAAPPASLVVARVVRSATATNETCAATSGGARCDVESATPWTLQLAWAQAPQHRVVVRVVGVRL